MAADQGLPAARFGDEGMPYRMRRPVALAGVALIAAVVAIPAVAASRTPERVTFASFDRDAATGMPVPIHALLFRPDDSSDARRPAVVALHGCGGMYIAAKSRRADLSLRHQAMADLLVAEGYIVLFPDSFRSRGREEICTTAYAQRKIRQANRRLDAQAALAYLQARPDVAQDRVAVLGWSHGGSTVLATLDAREDHVAAWRNRSAPSPYFRAGVAFYPGCRESLHARRGFSVAAPLAFFVGGADDWTAPAPCIDLARKLAAAGESVTIAVYPHTYHGFDGPEGPTRLRLDVPNGVHPGKGVTVAPNRVARDDAYARLGRFLREQLRGGPDSAEAARADQPGGR
jgi:dienelactone hydrolase